MKSAGDILLIMPLRPAPKLSTELANMDTSDIPNNSANVSALPSLHTSCAVCIEITFIDESTKLSVIGSGK